jgi:pimeloyl-ACP methyl ester carboxylesterase
MDGRDMIAGLPLNWRLTGPVAADGRALVLLHEALGSIGLWRDFPEALAAAVGLPVLVYERHGHGGSAPAAAARTADYLRREAVEVLPRLLSLLGIRRPLLVGHSDGGSIALLYAAAFPHRPLGAVTMAAHVFVETETLAGIRQAVSLFPRGLREKLIRYHGDNTDHVFAAWSDTWLAPWFADWNITADLPAIICPLLVIQGENDEYGTPAQVSAITGGVSGPARGLLLPDCAHQPQREARAAVLEAIQLFAGQIPCATQGFAPAG